MTCIVCGYQENNTNGVIGYCTRHDKYLQDPEHECREFTPIRLDCLRYQIWFEKTQIKYGQIRLNALIKHCHENDIDVKELKEP